MQKAVEYISEHYSESLSVSDMAELLHMSERSFMRGFKNRMHMNFTEFVTHTRIEHAAEMLRFGLHLFPMLRSAAALTTAIIFRECLKNIREFLRKNILRRTKNNKKSKKHKPFKKNDRQILT